MSGNSRIPFGPTGKTITLTAATSAPTPVQAPSDSGQLGAGEYRIVNSGTVTAFLGVGGTAAQATANSVVPTSTPTYAIPLLPGAVEVLRFIGDAYFSAITSSGTAVLYITPGNGL